MCDNIFCRHPRQQRETYLQHGIAALTLAAHASIMTIVILLASCIIIIHAIVPGVFVTHGSSLLLFAGNQIVSKASGRSPQHSVKDVNV
jgi:hypothetical protein